MIDIKHIERITRNKFFVIFTRLGQEYRWWVNAEDTIEAIDIVKHARFA